jgi:hypothetical protein
MRAQYRFSSRRRKQRSEVVLAHQILIEMAATGYSASPVDGGHLPVVISRIGAAGQQRCASLRVFTAPTERIHSQRRPSGFRIGRAAHATRAPASEADPG